MASLLDLDIESSCSLIPSPQPDRFETIPFSLNSVPLSQKDPKNMSSAKGNRFLPGSEWRPEPSKTSASPLRQPNVAPVATKSPGFGNRTPIFRTPQPSLPQYLGNDARVPQSQINGATPYSGVSFPAFSTGNQGLDGLICITGVQLNDCYGYALHRGGNVYTRLIPADRIPLLSGVPQTQGPDGLIVLPNTRGMSPNNRSNLYSDKTFQFVPSVIGNGRPVPKPSPVATDLVQTRIDRIVTTAPPAPQKRVKTHCAKWLHDGTCAFTQQGCRYKHEMPMDRATQNEVGLFNGLPLWYRRAQAADLRAGTNSFGNSSTGATNEGSVGDFSQGSAFGHSGGVPVRRGATTFNSGMSWRGGNAGRDVSEPRLAYQSFENMPAADEPRTLTVAGGRRSWVLSPSAAAPHGYPRGVLYQNRLMQANVNDMASPNAYSALYQYGGEEDGTDEV